MHALHTDKENDAALEIYKAETLPQLRRRQRICESQTAGAFKLRDDTALANLQTMSRLLADAVDYVAFEKPKRRKAGAAVV